MCVCVCVCVLSKENRTTESFQISPFKVGLTHVALFLVSTYSGIVNWLGNC